MLREGVVAEAASATLGPLTGVGLAFTFDFPSATQNFSSYPDYGGHYNGFSAFSAVKAAKRAGEVAKVREAAAGSSLAGKIFLNLEDIEVRSVTAKRSEDWPHNFLFIHPHLWGSHGCGVLNRGKEEATDASQLSRTYGNEANDFA